MKNFDFIKKEKILYKSDYFFIVADSFPVSDGYAYHLIFEEKRLF